MGQKYANNVQTTLASTITDSATTMTLTSATGFPTLVSGDWVMVNLINSDATFEIVKMTARTSVTCTIERAQEGTTATEHTADPVTVISITLTAGTLDKIEAAIDAVESAIDAVESDIDAVESDITEIETIITGKSSVRAYKETTQSLTTGTTQITFTAETRDTNSEFESSTFTAKTAGLYDIYSTLYMLAPTATTTIILLIYKNGAAVSNRPYRSGLTGQSGSYSILDTIELAIGDTIKIYVYVSVSVSIYAAEIYTFLTINGR